MREIKFRGLDINGRWFHGLLSVSQGKATQPKQGSYISNSSGSPFAYQVRPETVGQYTGLKDKDGNGIYEKDIVKHRKIGGQQIGVGPVTISPTQGVLVGSLPIGFDWEVIGNIYENPELLALE